MGAAPAYRSRRAATGSLFAHTRPQAVGYGRDAPALCIASPRVAHRYPLLQPKSVFMQLRLIFAILLLLSAPLQAQKKVPLPNGILIGENLYCDQTEISNINWLEYIFWTASVFGEQSPEYLASLPDTAVWIDSLPLAPLEQQNLKIMFSIYLRHPAYAQYPVIGISQTQAEAYSLWRSDRVMEGYLIKNNIIRANYVGQNPKNYFTCERFFRSELDSLRLSAEKIEYYPVFRLPTQQERQRILQFVDQQDSLYLRKCKKKPCKDCLKQFPYFYSQDVKELAILQLPVSVYWSACKPEDKDKSIYSIRGNVREWLQEAGLSAGGSFNDSREATLQQDIFQQDRADRYTGFRNVGEWRKWEPNK